MQTITTRIILLATIGLLGLTGCSTMSKKASNPAEKFLQAKTSRQILAGNGRMQYLLFLPANYSVGASEKVPLILFLHGAGERGTNVWKAATHGPSKYIEKHPDFPFILVVPLCPPREHWANEPLLGLLDEVTAKYSVDTNRIYVTGLSMGGYGTWELGASHPEKFAAIVPICGGGQYISPLLASYDGRTAALKSLPIWAFHGGKDTTVPPAESERMVKVMKDIGCKEVELTVYPQANHNSWTETYDNPKLYDWLLKHQRNAVK